MMEMEMEEDKDSAGYLELLANGNEGGRLLAQLIEWIHGLEKCGGGWYRDDIDHMAGVIVDSIVNMLDCSPDIFTGKDDTLNRELGLPPITEVMP